MGKKLPESKRRVRFVCLIHPATMKLIRRFAKDAGSQGLAVDKAVMVLATAESFGKNALNIGSDNGKA